MYLPKGREKCLTFTKILEKNNNYLRQTFHVREIGIFGSFVKGEEKTDNNSDIDILITFEKGYKDFFNYIRLKYYLEELLGREVDLVIKETVKPRLKERIFREVEYV
jgi:predicted nucleotidyltransferase